MHHHRPAACIVDQQRRYTRLSLMRQARGQREASARPARAFAHIAQPATCVGRQASRTDRPVVSQHRSASIQPSHRAASQFSRPARGLSRYECASSERNGARCGAAARSRSATMFWSSRSEIQCPRPDTKLLHQPALEGLTRSARTDSSRRIGRNEFLAKRAAAAAAWGSGRRRLFERREAAATQV
ncbi:hypothetical protein F511_34954 [Dorcoceras hygrometricum]|uniref:Uncharacterized protein n=1 Tax=Dorcoceras hygrometricum TaxID=472368 RepID=A0A2Z7ADC3_9LAMI|nr:hypothetical protein F511_34954 [Dorcoceras hygrometricum]